VLHLKAFFIGEAVVRHNLAEIDFITEEEYLAKEILADEKHEFLNGFVYRLHADPVTNMAGASDAQSRSQGMLIMCLRPICLIRNAACIWQICALRLIAKTRHGSTLMSWSLATLKIVNAIP